MLRINIIIFGADSKRRRNLPAFAPCVTELVQLTGTSPVIWTSTFGTTTTVWRGFTTRVISPNAALFAAFGPSGKSYAATIGVVGIAAGASISIPEATVVHAPGTAGIAHALCVGLRVATNIILPSAASNKAVASGFVSCAALFDAFLA